MVRGLTHSSGIHAIPMAFVAACSLLQHENSWLVGHAPEMTKALCHIRLNGSTMIGQYSLIKQRANFLVMLRSRRQNGPRSLPSDCGGHDSRNWTISWPAGDRSSLQNGQRT